MGTYFEGIDYENPVENRILEIKKCGHVVIDFENALSSHKKEVSMFFTLGLACALKKPVHIATGSIENLLPHTELLKKIDSMGIIHFIKDVDDGDKIYAETDSRVYEMLEKKDMIRPGDRIKIINTGDKFHPSVYEKDYEVSYTKGSKVFYKYAAGSNDLIGIDISEVELVKEMKRRPKI